LAPVESFSRSSGVTKDVMYFAIWWRAWPPPRIVLPMSGRGLGLVGAGNLIRRRARRQVEAKRARLHKAGIPSVLIEPGPEVVDVMGMNFMNGTNLPAIVGAAFLDTGDQLRAPITRTLLAGLNHRTRAPSPPFGPPVPSCPSPQPTTSSLPDLSTAHGRHAHAIHSGTASLGPERRPDRGTPSPILGPPS
jgi:hypothetical protein